MFAVIRTGGKQYRVAPGDVLEIERLPGEAGEFLVIGTKQGLSHSGLSHPLSHYREALKK